MEKLNLDLPKQAMVHFSDQKYKYVNVLNLKPTLHP